MFSQGFISPSKAKALEIDVVPCGLHVLTLGRRKAKFGYSSGSWENFSFFKEAQLRSSCRFFCMSVHV